jgi:hypothetical protein
VIRDELGCGDSLRLLHRVEHERLFSGPVAHPATECPRRPSTCATRPRRIMPSPPARLPRTGEGSCSRPPVPLPGRHGPDLIPNPQSLIPNPQSPAPTP